MFVPLAERIADALLEASPAAASFAGDHRFDDQLPDFSPDGVVAKVAMLRDAAVALSQVDTEGLELAEQTDHAILSTIVDRQLFELTDLREHEWNPLRHNPGALLHALLARPFAPVAQRLESIAGRLEKIPDTLAVARTVLRDCPQIHLETAAQQFAGAAALVRGEIPAMLAEVPSLTGRVQPAADAAGKALDEFAAWCAAAGHPRRRARPAVGAKAVGCPALVHAGHRALRGTGAAARVGQP